MSDEKPAKPSMKEFDYFSDNRAPVDAEALAERDDLPSGLEQQILLFQRERRARGRVVILAVAAFAAASWFVWGYRDWVAYAFAGGGEPLALGDVTGIKPSEIRHNAYVELDGITEHRGLTQKMVRGLSLNRQELWYFRLLGSQGVFIEVPPDPETYSPITAVRVRGRAVDPERETSYSALLQTYDRKWFPEERPSRRVIQVGIEPGHGRGAFIIVFLLLSLVGAANMLALWRFARTRRDVTGRPAR